MLIPILAFLTGWLTSIWVNHAATAIPAKETIWQQPYYQSSHRPKPLSAWSAFVAHITHTDKCPQTGQPDGLRPYLVELALPVIFVFLSLRYPPTLYLVFLLVYTTILVLLTITDLEHRLIQNVIILPAIILGVAGSFVTPTFNWRQALLGGALAFIIFYLLAILARGGLGSGDVTLSAFLGIIIGFPNIIYALIFGVLLGGAVSAILVILRRVTLKTFIPYGPFLIVAGWVMLVWGDQIQQLLL